MELQLPKSQHRAFVELARLDEQVKERAIDFLRSQSQSFDVDQLAEAFAEKVGVETETAQRILRMLSSMYAARLRMGVPAEVFAQAVCRAASSSTSPELKLEEGTLSRICEFLEQVLSSETTLGIAARGMDLLQDQERTFSQARILTDFRPIFREDLDGVPRAGVIFHRLRIDYEENGEDKAFWITLDSTDLESLKSAVERAIEKDAGLRAAFSATIPCLP